MEIVNSTKSSRSTKSIPNYVADKNFDFAALEGQRVMVEHRHKEFLPCTVAFVDPAVGLTIKENWRSSVATYSEEGSSLICANGPCSPNKGVAKQHSDTYPAVFNYLVHAIVNSLKITDEELFAAFKQGYNPFGRVVCASGM